MKENEERIIYRYFHLNREKDIFSNLTQLNFSSADEYLAYVRERGLAVKTYNEEYLRRRFATEAALHEQFVRKGGRPRIRHPYYFTLGRCDDWFYGRKRAFGSAAFRLEEFDPDTISFTYGDSVPTFMEEFQDGKEYRSRVYTLPEIRELIGRYGMPNVWNTFEALGPENYIEVQIWTDEFRSEITNRTTRFCDMSVTELTSRILLANPNFPPETIRQRSAASFIEECRGSCDWPWFASLIRSTEPGDFCRDRVHGLPHAHKCALMAFVLAMQLELDEKARKTLVYAALYHDVGRRYHDEGKPHGQISAEKIERFIRTGDEVYLLPLKHALARHEDRPAPSDTGNPFLPWLRSIDSLDYLRLGIRRFDPRHIRTGAAKALLRFSLELNILMYLDDRFLYDSVRR